MNDNHRGEAGAASLVRIGDQLVARKLISAMQLEIALREQHVTGEKLGVVLVRNGFLSRKQFLDVLLEISPSSIQSEYVYTTKVPADVMRDAKIMLVNESAEMVYAATLKSEAYATSRLRPYYPRAEIRFVAASPERVETYLADLADASDDSALLDWLIRQALVEGASDIHIVPRYASFTVFFRQHGVRHPVHEGSPEDLTTLTAKVKDRARMDLAERRIDQDGNFQVEYNGRLVDIRAVTLPTPDGEYIVMRLLDPDKVQPSLEALGVSRLQHWISGISRPDGLCLVCGPTGSGKSSTLNATLKSIDRFESAVFTVEDPVEYRIAFAGQVNVNKPMNLDFARAVRSFMRADPDVIVLGEMRDPETAANGVKGAETGHLVLATLHTGSIRGAVQRLHDLGVSKPELLSTLRAILVQRLIRTTCPHCHGAGCPDCGGRGFAGRTLVSECQYFSTENDVRRLLDGETWWPSMLEDAIDKSDEGVTTIAEVERVFGAAEVKQVLAARRAQGEAPPSVDAR